MARHYYKQLEWYRDDKSSLEILETIFFIFAPKCKKRGTKKNQIEGNGKNEKIINDDGFSFWINVRWMRTKY